MFAAFNLVTLIQEHHGIQTDVQPLRQEAEVAGLVVPVGNETGQVGFAQHHVGVLLKRLAGPGLIVLAAHRQQDTALAELFEEVLQAHEAFACPADVGAQGNALQTVITDDAVRKGQGEAPRPHLIREEDKDNARQMTKNGEKV